MKVNRDNKYNSPLYKKNTVLGALESGPACLHKRPCVSQQYLVSSPFINSIAPEFLEHY